MILADAFRPSVTCSALFLLRRMLCFLLSRSSYRSDIVIFVPKKIHPQIQGDEVWCKILHRIKEFGDLKVCCQESCRNGTKMSGKTSFVHLCMRKKTPWRSASIFESSYLVLKKRNGIARIRMCVCERSNQCRPCQWARNVTKYRAR